MTQSPIADTSQIQPAAEPPRSTPGEGRAKVHLAALAGVIAASVFTIGALAAPRLPLQLREQHLVLASSNGAHEQTQRGHRVDQGPQPAPAAPDAPPPAVDAGTAAAVAGSAPVAAPPPPDSSTRRRMVQMEELPNTIGTLKGVKPLEADLSEYIVDKVAAQQLGKAFYWDIQVGSQGVACATCHFHAGADIRTRNQVNPGLKANDTTFGVKASDGRSAGPNADLTWKDFPFRKLQNIVDRESEALFETNNVFSSQGSFGGTFVSRPVVPHPRSDGEGRDGAGFTHHHHDRNHHRPDDGTEFVRGTRHEHPVRGVRREATGQGHAHHARGHRKSDDQTVEPTHDHAEPGPPPRHDPLAPNETCTYTYDPANNPFHANGLIYRKVEPRQTPTTINAVFNHRQFWDGRANNQFNGVNPFGPRAFQGILGADGPGNPDAAKTGTLVLTGVPSERSTGLTLEQRLIDNASLASQAVGPPLSDFEMSCAGKTFADLGRKLIPLRALAKQTVHRGDSLFSHASDLTTHGGAKGLNITYQKLIERAFAPKFWSSTTKVRINADGSVAADPAGFTQMEHNFSLFWGLAVMAYESLLVSDDSPFDRALAGDPNAMTDEARAGMNVFLNRGNCVGCHFGPVMSGAAVTSADKAALQVMEHMRVGSGMTALYDRGYYNIGVRPSVEDLGVGATDPYGFDLSFSRAYKWRQLGQAAKAPDKFQSQPCRWMIQFYPCQDEPRWSEPYWTARDAVDGSFKVPILRNVGLNPPYFHNGGQATLRDVVMFYNRGGDRRGSLARDTSGVPVANTFGQVNDSNLDPDVGEASAVRPEYNNAIKLSAAEIDNLVQFLLSLSDERVACHSGIFDHPELPLPMGHLEKPVTGTQFARDIVRVLPAVGSGGLKGIGKPCFPNSGDLFGSVNTYDPTPLQATFLKILDLPRSEHLMALGMAQSDVAAALAAGATALAADVPPPPPVAARAAVTSTSTTGFLTASLLPPAPPVPPAVFTAGATTLRGFEIVGFIQDATVSGDRCPGVAQDRRGGTVVVNDITIVVPCNLRLQMPGATLNWSELFAPTTPGGGVPASLKLGERPVPAQPGGFVFPSTEIRVVGNNVAGTYVAGLVSVSQQTLNTSTGYIVGFDYETGVILVGDARNGSARARVQLNDPSGRFSKGQSPDTRFRVDEKNPSVRAVSGYPMCIPRQDPARGDDPRCPQRNRPLAPDCRNFLMAGVVFPAGRELKAPSPGQKYCSGFVMGDPATAKPTEPIATEQAPFQIGDLITYSGTLLLGDGQSRGEPDTILAHTVIANVGIFTQPDTLPVYLAMGEFRIGTFDPASVVNGVVQEEQDRLILEAVTTDVRSIVDIYLVDVDPATGAEQQRWVTPGSMTGGVGGRASNGRIIDGGITTQFNGPVPGRVRLAAGRAVPGILASPTRYIRVVARGLCDPANINTKLAQTGQPAGSPPVACIDRMPAANGIKSGQFAAPTTEFIFAETILPGDVPASNNFWSLGFLANGEGPGQGPLTPTPW